MAVDHGLERSGKWYDSVQYMVGLSLDLLKLRYYYRYSRSTGCRASVIFLHPFVVGNLAIHKGPAMPVDLVAHGKLDHPRCHPSSFRIRLLTYPPRYSHLLLQTHLTCPGLRLHRPSISQILTIPGSKSEMRRCTPISPRAERLFEISRTCTLSNQAPVFSTCGPLSLKPSQAPTVLQAKGIERLGKLQSLSALVRALLRLWLGLLFLV